MPLAEWIPAPAEVPGHLLEQLANLQADLLALEQREKENTAKLALANAKVHPLASLRGALDEVERHLDGVRQRIATALTAAGVSWDDIITVDLRRSVIDAAAKAVEADRGTLLGEMDALRAGSIAGSKAAVASALAAVKSQMGSPGQAYATYLAALRTWEDQRDKIVGDLETPESITHLEERVRRIKEDVPNQLAEARAALRGAAAGVCETLELERDVLTELFAPVGVFLKGGAAARAGLAVEFSVEADASSFTEGLLEYVNQGRRGSYMGNKEGRQTAKSLLDANDLNSSEGVLGFVDAVMLSLHTDQRTNQPVDRVEDQLRKGTELAAVYGIVNRLSFLRLRYSLTLGGRSIGLLSPGEKGALLIAFYLLLDPSGLPLIVDQPEHNLDNETVYDLLVPCFREAKEHRQVILVTHNPNLAVVCDAEQVVYSSIERSTVPTATYVAGALENPDINKLVVSVLEGTMPAFRKRDGKYLKVEPA